MRTLIPANRERAVKRMARWHWEPRRIHPPLVDPELPNLGEIQRVAEVFRYSILSLEYWISPNGMLREWLKLNGKVACFLSIPTLLIAWSAALIPWQLAVWMWLLLSITSNIIMLPLAALLATAIIAGMFTLIRVILGRWRP